VTKEVNLPVPLAFPSEKRTIPPESPKAARAYSDYESMGPDRSMAKLALQYGRKSGYVRQLERWSEWYNWQQRLKDYERVQLEERRKKRQKELEDMDKRHADYGRSSLYESIKYINEHLNDEEIVFINKEGKQEKKPRTTIAQAVSLMRASYELERLARGAATERIEGDMTMTILPKEYLNLSPDEEGSEP
jgi:hypothetical protein